jgi:CRP/FNR family transcriptional regulator, cyclic AMP receptor protein
VAGQTGDVFSRGRVANAVRLLDVDPDLGEALEGERADSARQQLLAGVVRLERGTWEPDPDGYGARGGVGLLLVEGLIARRVALADRTCAELLGPGDLLRPWQKESEHAALPFDTTFRTIKPATIAVLDRRFCARLMRWPEVVCTLLGRALQRSRNLAAHMTIAQLPRIEVRLLVLFWHLADRWGRVRTGGVWLPLPLSHELLGAIIGARRPSVTSALSLLSEQGVVLRQDDGSWLLTGEPPTELLRTSGAQRPRLVA